MKGSQFRLYSFFSSASSECDFSYHWKSSQPNSVNILSNKSLIAVNVSAKDVGKSRIEFDVVNSRGKVIGTAEEFIEVVDKYDMVYPSYIEKPFNNPS